MNDFLTNLPGYNLRRASTAVQTQLTDALAHLSLRPADFSMLITIKNEPRVTPSELGKQLGIQRANMVNMVTRLEERGAVSRIALDGRSYGLELTQTGIDLCAQAQEIVETLESELLMRVPPEHRDHLLPALHALWMSQN